MEKSKQFNAIRTGRFTSSEIWQLVSNGRKQGEPGATFFSYCKRVASERLLGFKGKSSSEAFPTEWGHVAEAYVAKILESEGWIIGFSDCPITHQSLEFAPYWSGTPDAVKSDRIGEIKCPVSSEKYFDLLGITTEEMKDGESKEALKYYWQMVSNACITGKDIAELIVFCPTEQDLEVIKTMNENEGMSFRVSWAKDDAFPCTKDERFRVYRMEFTVPEEDKIFLQERVRLAIENVENLITKKLQRL